MAEKAITLPIVDESVIMEARAGDFIHIGGILYTARDQAHKRLLDFIDRNETLPLDLKGQGVYYCGPTPPRQDRLFGSAGPTTSSRMDGYTVALLEKGLKITVGKGSRSVKIQEACQKYRSLYLVTFGGAGAFLAKRIIKQEIIAYPDLGAEAIYKLWVDDFPALVAYDAHGGSIF